MNWGGIAALLGSAVGLVVAIGSLIRERSTLRQLERITAITTALQVNSHPRQQMEAIQNHLVAKYYARSMSAGSNSGSWAFFTAIACFLLAISFMGTGVAERTKVLPPSPMSGTYVLVGSLFFLLGLGFLVYGTVRLRALRTSDEDERGQAVADIRFNLDHGALEPEERDGVSAAQTH
jgi:hypothetical protein